jgi:hypothetical protein
MIIRGVTRRIAILSVAIMKFDGKYTGAKQQFRLGTAAAVAAATAATDPVKFARYVQYDRLWPGFGVRHMNGEDNVAKHSPRCHC